MPVCWEKKCRTDQQRTIWKPRLKWHALDTMKLAMKCLSIRWIERQNDWVGDKVMKLREETQLLTRLL